MRRVLLDGAAGDAALGRRAKGRHFVNEVKVGQVWADNDRRSAGRHLRVVAMEAGDDGRAVVQPCTSQGALIADRQTRIRRDRFKPTSTGYRLVVDVDENGGLQIR